MKNLIKVFLFSLIMIGIFTLFSTSYIPPVVPEPPPEARPLKVTGLTLEEFVLVGKKIFDGTGGCMLCHDPKIKRAPEITTSVRNAAKTIELSSYSGVAKNAEEYLIESLVNPSAYVTPGYGVEGGSPMIGFSESLSEAEILALVAYLQRLSGVEVSVKIP